MTAPDPSSPRNPYGPAVGDADPSWAVADPGGGAFPGGPFPAGTGGTPPRSGMSHGAVIAIVLGSVAALVLGLGMAGGVALLLWRAGAEAGSDMAWDQSDYTDDGVWEGEVHDASGTVLADTGTWDAPAAVGDSTLVWPTDDGGTVSVVVSDVQWEADAEVAAAAASNRPASDGTHYALVTLDVSYSGQSFVLPYDVLYVSVETDMDIFSSDDELVRPPRPLWAQGGIADGETGSGQVAIEVPDAERAGALIGVSPWNGTTLYVDGR